MKKIILVLSLVSCVLCLVSITEAQSTSPRWGNPPGNDNTGRVLTWIYNHPVYPTANDTLRVVTHAYETLYKIDTVKDASRAFKIVCDTTDKKTPFVNAHVGDKVEFIFGCVAGSKTVVFSYGFTTNASGGATLDLVANGETTISFIYDGIFWREESRSIQ